VADGPLDLGRALFLAEADRTTVAADHVVRYRAELDGGDYPTLLDLALWLEGPKFRLAQTCLYRALLDSILERGRSKTYHHGARYLEKLDALAGQVARWDPIEPHELYRERLFEQHRRKRSFWGRVSGD
jgi:hypothetical protein